MNELSAFYSDYQKLILTYSERTSEEVLYSCSELGKQLAAMNIGSDEIVNFHHEAVRTLAPQLDKQAIINAHDLLTELALHQKLALEREINANQSMMIEVERKKLLEQSILSAFPDTIIKLSNRLDLIDVNNHFFSLFSYSNLNEVTFSELFQAPEVITQAIKRTLETGIRTTLTENLRLANGQLCPSEISMMMLFDVDLNNDGIMLVIRDLRESIDVEQRLVLAKQMVFDVIEAIPQRIYWLSKDLRLLGCNSHFLSDIGHHSLDTALSDLHLSHNLKDIFLDHSTAQNILSNQLSFFNSERSITLTSDTRIDIHEQALPLKSPSGEIYGVICCYEDITRIKEEQTKNERLVEQLNQTQRIESIGKLASSIAHDFNNMLSVILGYSQLLERIFSDTDFYKESDYISRIINASEKAKLLTSKLLSFSKKDIKKLEVLELCKCVEETLVTYGSIIGEDIIVDFQTQESGCIQADRTQIDQVILNLLVNSRDAMLDNIQQGKKQIDIDISYENDINDQEQGNIILTLKDNGCGIKRDDLDRIFEPFYSTKKDLGTGLGLSTVYSIVKQQGGDISVSSQLGKGTTFRISWPQVFNHDANTANIQHNPQTERSVLKPLKKRQIYLVEDEQGVRNLIQALLSESGYQVSVFDNGNSLLEYLENEPPAPALLITDLILTNQLNGKQLAERFSAFYPAVPILYVSGYSHELISKRGIVLDNVNFIKKPFEISKLLNTVSQLINS